MTVKEERSLGFLRRCFRGRGQNGRTRFVSAIGLVSITVSCVLAVPASSVPPAAPGWPSEENVKEGEADALPLRIVFVSYGDWVNAERRMWFLTLDERGRVNSDPHSSDVKQLSPQDVERLRQIVRRERFFELGDAYGGCVDCPQCWLTVELGDQKKRLSVTMIGLDDLSPSQHEEMARAVRVWDSLKEMLGLSAVHDGCHDGPDTKDDRR